ncbi:MAG: type IV secretory system conjugative DNA transfer family protein, partial [Solirubrobacteraceae bacterium]
MTPHLSLLGVLAAAGAVIAFGAVGKLRSGTARRSPRSRASDEGARWARHRDLRALCVEGNTQGRLVVGVEGGRARRRRVVAAEPAQSVAVIGPTQSGKTTSVAIPAILAWCGPVLAASVKTDLVRDTLAWRSQCGRVWCFDPAGTTGIAPSTWSPVLAATTWARAREVAADLTGVAHVGSTSADGEFWYAMAAKLLAPLLLAACHAGLGIEDVVRWVDTQESEEVVDILEEAGAREALQALRATVLREDRQRSSVYTTAESVLEPFAEPAGWFGDEPGEGPRGAYGGEIDPHALLSGSHTLYVCSPAHDQRRLRALFVALVEQVLHAAFARAARAGRPLD